MQYDFYTMLLRFIPVKFNVHYKNLFTLSVNPTLITLCKNIFHRLENVDNLFPNNLGRGKKSCVDIENFNHRAWSKIYL